MASKTARSTYKISDSQRYLLNISTFVTRHACPSWTNLHQLRTACYSFVFQALDKSTPRSVRYMFSELVISDHVLNLQILDSNSAKFSYNLPAHLVQEIKPLIANSFIQPTQSNPCFPSVSRAFDFPVNSPMQNLQLCFGLEQMSGISYKLSIGESDKTFKPNINTNFIFGRMNNIDFRQFTAENSKPLTAFGLLDSESLDFAFRDSVQDNGDISDFRSIQSLVINKPKITSLSMINRLRISNAHNSGFIARKSFLFDIFLDTPKKILERFIQTISNILFDLRINTKIFASKIFAIIKFIQRNIAKLVSVFVKRKNIVINLLTGDERINKSGFLFPTRINPEFIHQQAHANWLDGLLYKAYAGMSSGSCGAK